MIKGQENISMRILKIYYFYSLLQYLDKNNVFYKFFYPSNKLFFITYYTFSLKKIRPHLNFQYLVD